MAQRTTRRVRQRLVKPCPGSVEAAAIHLRIVEPASAAIRLVVGLDALLTRRPAWPKLHRCGGESDAVMADAAPRDRLPAPGRRDL